MRKFLMTGSALILMGGVAFAQTPAGGQAPTAGMNNTGVTGQMPGSTSGNMATSTSGNGSTMAPTSGMNNSAATGATPGTSSGDMTASSPNSNTAMPTERQSTMGKTMNKSAMGGGMYHTAMRNHYHNGMMNHGMMGHSMGGMMPENASAPAYLHIAQQAVMSHNKMRAHDALGRAETDLLTNSYVQGSVDGPISTPAIQAIRGARKAVEGGDYHQASMMIHKAMMDMHGGAMGHPGMDKPGMGTSSDMGVPPTNTGMAPNGGAMNNGAMNNDSVPGASMQGKKDSTMHHQMTNSTNSSM